MTNKLSIDFYIFSYKYTIMKGESKKLRQMLFLSKSKKIIILGLTCCLLIGGLSPTINNAFITNPEKINEAPKDGNNQEDSEYKKMSYDDGVHVYASFYWSPKYPDPGELVTFYSTSCAYNGLISSEVWRFYDGHGEYGHRTTHTFDKKGTYKVTLSVIAYGHDSAGPDLGSGSITKYVKISADPIPKITFTPENPSPGEKVILNASESSDPDGKIMSYNWSYYDVEDPGNVTYLGSNEKIYHVWKKQGIYVVSLYTEDNKGNNNTLDVAIHVSILKLGGFSARSRGLSFEISNYDQDRANNVNWNVEIHKYSLLGIRSKSIYQKSGTIPSITFDNSEIIEIKNIRRRFCKIKLVVTVEADNAVEVSKSFYGLIFGKFIFLTEDNFINPYSVITISGIISAGTLLTIFSFSRNM